MVTLKYINWSNFQENLSEFERQNHLDMYNLFWKKPDLELKLTDLDQNNIHVTMKTFQSKTDVVSEYLMNNKERYTNLINDVNTLIKNTRIKDTPVYTEIIDRDSQTKDPEYLYKNQNTKYLKTIKPMGYMTLSGHQNKDQSFDVNQLYVKSIATSPKVLVHEFGHLIDFAYGQGGLDDPNNTEIYRSYNDPDFKNIREEYRKELVNIYKTNKPSLTDDKINNVIMNNKVNMYYMDPTEIHSRLFENFYSTEIEPYRNLGDFNRGDIYNDINDKYGVICPTSGDRAATIVYNNNEFVRHWFKSTYNEILPQNHPEYEKYTGKALSDEEYQSARTDQYLLYTTRYRALVNHDFSPHDDFKHKIITPFDEPDTKTETIFEPPSDKSNTLSDEQLLNKYEQIAAEALTQQAEPNNDISFEL